jgi:hypothetical protein
MLLSEDVAMKNYHLPSVHGWGATIERSFEQLGRWLFSPLKHWRTRLPAWKGKR